MLDRCFWAAGFRSGSTGACACRSTPPDWPTSGTSPAALPHLPGRGAGDELLKVLAMHEASATQRETVAVLWGAERAAAEWYIDSPMHSTPKRKASPSDQSSA